MKSFLQRAERAKRDERGAVLILSVGGLILALVASALAVDLGRQANEKKTDQLIADLAALDAARELEPLLLSVPGVDVALTVANVQQAAEDSAERNGFDADAEGHDVVAELGTTDAQNQFTPGGTSPDAVKVTVTSVIPYVFDMGERTLSATAIAKMSSGGGPGSPGTDPTTGTGNTTPGTPGGARAGFDLGSALASFSTDAASVPVVNRIFSQMIGGNADVVSWSGLGNANVGLAALRQELANLGTSAGTPQELMASDLTLNRLFTATANVLDQQGTSEATAAANLFRGSAGIIAQSTNTTTFKLGEIMEFDQGGGDTIADGNIKVRHLVVAAAEAANGDNVISVPDAGVTVPGVSRTSVALQIVEPRKYVFGPEGMSGETAQIKLTVTPTLDFSPSIPLLSDPKVTGNFPFLLQSAGAKGTIDTINCTSPGLTVGVDTRPVTGAGSAALRVTQRLPLVGQVDVLDVPTVATMPQVAEKHTDLSFAYNTEFHPVWDGSKQAGTYPVNIAGAEVALNGTPTVLNLPVGVPQLTVVDGVLNAVRTTLGRVENQIVNPLVRRLGLTVGVADIVATDLMCNPTQPPTSIPPGPGTPGTPATPPSGSGELRPVLVG
jgi:uncharacterized membrane protein